MYLRRRLKEQNGFTLVEIFVALMILSIALIPMTNMFSTAVTGLLDSETIRNSAQCATAAMEQITSMPFYQPYNGTDVDIDDHFWGNRNPIYFSPAISGSPDWTQIPEVLAMDYNATPVFSELSSLSQYKGCKVTVSLAYLNDDTSAAAMSSTWGPELSGNDKPLAADNTTPHLILVHINVYYKLKNYNGPSQVEEQYLLEQILTDTQAIYGVGVHDAKVLGPAANQDPNKINAATHWPNNNIQLQIDGWGFDTSTITAYLVRNKYSDIPINLTSKTSTLLLGTADLYDTGTQDVVDEPDCYPRAGIGFWSVRIQQQGIVNAYLFNGFIVEFPKPVINDFYNGTGSSGTKTSTNDQDAQVITVKGGPFPYKKDTNGNLVWYSSVSLEPVNGTTSDRIVGDVTSVAGSNNGYTASPNCTIVATFDLTGAKPGQYKMLVWNTDAAAVGHMASDYSSGIYTITAVPPTVTDVYVSNTNPHQTNVYQNINNHMVNLEIIGRNFNTLTGPPYVRVYLYPSVSGAGQPPGSTMYEATAILNVTTTDISARFDLSSLSTGAYNVYVVNQDYGTSGYITASSPRITVRSTYSGSITNFTCNLGAFYENYYDYSSDSNDCPSASNYRVQGTITGTSLLDVTDVTIKDTSTGGLEYSDMAYTINSATQIVLNLNLIGCDHTHSWQLRVYVGDTYYMTYNFNIVLGKAIMVGYNTFGDSRSALYIDRGGTLGISYETASRAKAKRSGTGIFHVRGMGFPINDNTTLTLSTWTGAPSGSYPCSMDRAGKIVSLTSAQWNMPGTSANYNISVQSPGFTADTDNGRWQVTNNGS